MKKENIEVKQSNALKGFLFRAYHAGSGFTYWPAYSYKNMFGKKAGESWLVCEEVYGKGVIFNKTPGDFCVKLFKGTKLGTPTVAAYKMKL